MTAEKPEESLNLNSLVSYSPADILDAQIPDLLWHYTSLEGFTGILESKRIWATEIRYLNDESEFNHALSLLHKAVDQLDPFGSLVNTQDLLQSVLKGAKKGLLSKDSQNLFVASFSKHGDQLSQWRGYGQGGRGVSLGFDLTKLRPPAESGSTFAFGPCVYKPVLKKAIIHNSIDKVRLAAEGWLKDMLKELDLAAQQGKDLTSFAKSLTTPDAMALLRKTTEAFLVELFRFTPFLKHESFEEEAEWRIVAPLSPGGSVSFVKRFMRHGTSMLLPTVNPSLRGTGEKELPLKQVIIGPVPEPELAADAVRLHLKWQGLEEVEVTSSKVPFRSW